MNSPKQVFELSKEDFRIALKEELESIHRELFFSKFENIIVPIHVATIILGVSEQTIYRFITKNKLSCLPRSTQEAYRFSLRVILEFKHNH